MMNEKVFLKQLQEQFEDAQYSYGTTGIKVGSLDEVKIILASRVLIINPLKVYFYYQDHSGKTHNVFLPNNSKTLESIKNRLQKHPDLFKGDLNNSLFYDYVTHEFSNYFDTNINLSTYNTIITNKFKEAMQQIYNSSSDLTMIWLAKNYENLQMLTKESRIIFDALQNKADLNNVIHLNLDSNLSTYFHEFGHALHNGVNSGKVPADYLPKLYATIEHIKNNSEVIQKFSKESLATHEKVTKQAEKIFTKEEMPKVRKELFTEELQKSLNNMLAGKNIDPNAFLETIYQEQKQTKTDNIYNNIMNQEQTKIDILNGFLSDVLGVSFGNLNFTNENGETVNLASQLITSHPADYYKRSNALVSSFHEIMASFTSIKCLDALNHTNLKDDFIKLFGQEFYDYLDNFFKKTVLNLFNEQKHQYPALSEKEILVYSLYLNSTGNILNTKEEQLKNITKITLNRNNIIMDKNKYFIDDLITKLKEVLKYYPVRIDCSFMDENALNELGSEISYFIEDDSKIEVIMPDGLIYNFKTVLLNENNQSIKR